MTVTCSHHPWRAFGLELIPGNRGARGMLWWPQTSSPLARPITHELEAPASTACQSHRAPCFWLDHQHPLTVKLLVLL